MNRIFIILFFLFLSRLSFAQSPIPGGVPYRIPQNNIYIGPFGGQSYLQGVKGYFTDTLFITPNRLKLLTGTNGYVVTSDANGNLSLQPASGGGGTPSLPNRSVQLNQNGSFHGSDSMIYNNGAFILKHNDSVGLFFSYDWATNPLSSFTDNTATATVTTGGGKTNINGGAYNFSNSLNLPFYTGVDNYTYHIARVVPRIKNNTSIGIGVFISATTGMGQGTLFNAFLSDTAQYIAYSPGQSLTDGNSINNKSYTTFQFSAFDTLDIYLNKNQRTQTFTVINEANGSQMQLTISNVIATVGQPAIYTYGGNYDFLGSYTLTYNEVHNPLLAEMTNSIGWGANSSTILNNYFAILTSRYRTYGVKMSAPTESSLNGTYRVADALAVNPHVLLWAYGVGDFGTAVPLDSFSARIIRTIVPLKAAGIQIVFVNCVPNNGGSVVPYNDTIAAIGTRYSIPVADIYSALVGTGTNINTKYLYDGTHPNTEGHLVAANVIDRVLQNYITPQYSPLVAQLPPSSDITLPFARIDGHNNLVSVQAVPDTNNILNTSIVSSQTIQNANFNINGIGAMNSLQVVAAGTLNATPYLWVKPTGEIIIAPFTSVGLSTLPGNVTQQSGGFIWLTGGSYIEGLTQPVKLQGRNPSSIAGAIVEITNKDESVPIKPAQVWLSVYSQVAGVNDTLMYIDRGGGGHFDSTIVTPNIFTANSDSTAWKPVVVDASGNQRKGFWIGAGGGGNYAVATAVNTSNYTITTSNYIILADLTGQASRTVTLPSPASGQPVILDNTANSASSGFTWTVAGGTVKDWGGSTVTTLNNQSVYFLVYKGTNWQIQ